MNVTIEQSGPLLTDAELNQFEHDHGRKIPDAYREFLLKHNGGRPDPSGFKMPSGVDSNREEYGAVKRFLGINMSEISLDLGYVLKTFGHRISSNLFPIARDPGGNLIGIVVQGESAGRVLFWDHEREAEEGENPTDENTYLIADTFNEFLDSLENE